MDTTCMCVCMCDDDDDGCLTTISLDDGAKNERIGSGKQRERKKRRAQRRDGCGWDNNTSKDCFQRQQTRQK